MNDSPKKKKKSRLGCMWGLLVLACLAILGGCALLVSAWMADTLGLGDVATEERTMGVDEYPDLDEIWSYGDGTAKVIHVSLSGFIQLGEDSSLFGATPGSSTMALMSIRRATHDPDVAAIIMDINSGGGGITASDIIYKALQDFKEAQPGRKIIALYGDVAASGAYYISLAADHIMARPTSITGSIGVLMQTINIQEMAQKIGLRDVTIASGKNKDMLNPMKEVSPEQMAMLQSVVDSLHERFMNLVGDNRELPPNHVRKLADGRIFTAQKAWDVGLIDDIGYYDDAVEQVEDALEVDAVKIYRYEESFSLSSFLRGKTELEPTTLLRRISSPRLFYLWQL